jgi:glycosyltransferase involved in cell wall biosynthesis
LSTTIQERACPVCDSRSGDLLCNKNGYRIWRCPTCCSDHVWPMPEDRVLSAYYDQVSYFKGGEIGGYQDYDDETKKVIPLVSELLTELEQSCTGRTILDIGCAYGTHLAIAADRGWTCCGIEISEHARQVAQQRHGDKLRILAGLDDLDERRYDVITLFDVLEHLKEPYDLFFKLFGKGTIGRDTHIAITTPNARSHEAVTDPENWVYRYPPAHLVYYSAESLRLFLTRLGFSDVQVSGIYPLSDEPKKTSLDEDSELNQRTSRYAGLLCRTGGFSVPLGLSDNERHIRVLRQTLSARDAAIADTAPAIAERDRARSETAAAIAERDHARSETAAAIAERDRARSETAAAIADRDRIRGESAITIAERERKINVLGQEIVAFRQSRLYRLRELVLHEPFSLRKLASIGYLCGAMLLPRSVRKALAPFVMRLKARGVPRPPLREAGATYQVRMPAQVKPQRKRIVHAIANFMTGGSSRLVVDLIERLGHEYEQEIVTSYLPDPPAYVGPVIHEFRHLAAPWAVLDYFRNFRPDIIHVHYWADCDKLWYDQIFKAAELYGCKIVENINTPVDPYVSDHVDNYVYVSEHVLDHFAERSAKSRVIYPGSDLDVFRAQRQKLPQPDCIGMVYRLEGDKLNENSIDVFIKVVQRRPGTKALIVGGGRFLERYRAAVAAAGVSQAFTFSGYVPYEELPRLYSQMTLFVAPVWKESFGQVSPFAMSMGMPVVGYDVGALNEIIGTREFLAPPGDSERLANIVIDLLDDPDRVLAVGRSNQHRAQALFSVQSMIERYSRLYEELLN